MYLIRSKVKPTRANVIPFQQLFKSYLVKWLPNQDLITIANKFGNKKWCNAKAINGVLCERPDNNWGCQLERNLKKYGYENDFHVNFISTNDIQKRHEVMKCLAKVGHKINRSPFIGRAGV